MMLLSLGLGAGRTAAQDGTLDVTVQTTRDFAGFTPPTPINISGFSAEVTRVLDFDLTIMGFKNVPTANYTLTGSGTANLQAQLSFDKKVFFSKVYSGARRRIDWRTMS
jgi:hypothetical protein